LKQIYGEAKLCSVPEMQSFYIAEKSSTLKLFSVLKSIFAMETSIDYSQYTSKRLCIYKFMDDGFFLQGHARPDPSLKRATFGQDILVRWIALCGE
jgi:hypothetical protein